MPREGMSVVSRAVPLNSPRDQGIAAVTIPPTLSVVTDPTVDAVGELAAGRSLYRMDSAAWVGTLPGSARAGSAATNVMPTAAVSAKWRTGFTTQAKLVLACSTLAIIPGRRVHTRGRRCGRRWWRCCRRRPKVGRSIIPAATAARGEPDCERNRGSNQELAIMLHIKVPFVGVVFRRSRFREPLETKRPSSARMAR